MRLTKRGCFIPKLFLPLYFCATAFAGDVLIQWDATPDPYFFYEAELNGKRYYAGFAPPLPMELPPGRYNLRMITVNAETLQEGVVSETTKWTVLDVEESVDLNVWSGIKALVMPATDDKQFYRLRIQ